jgi:hypothetical protein
MKNLLKGDSIGFKLTLALIIVGVVLILFSLSTGS